jgi:hypothetical protein
MERYMTKAVFISAETGLDFLRRCNVTATRIEASIEKTGRLIILDNLLSWKRTKVLHYYSNALGFFVRRAEFFLDSIERGGGYTDILETSFRGLIEIYCRILFLVNSGEDENLKKIIWNELYILGLSGSGVLRNGGVRLAASIDYKILTSLRVDVPNIEKFIRLIQKSLAGEQKDAEGKAFEKIKNKMGFPSVRSTIIKYLNEDAEPKITKYFLYRCYSTLSEQIHGNFLVEYAGTRDRRSPAIALLILIYLRFLLEIARHLQSESEVSSLLEEFKDLRSDFGPLLNFSIEFAS